MKTKVLMDGLMFPEGPRWHDDRLWFSDMQGLHVTALDATGKSEKITTWHRFTAMIWW
ncbi:MAG: hypothetical protein P8X85_07025 [Desulfobacterales bacterium]